MEGDFRVGAWLVEPKLNSISANGKSTRVEPKVMQVLVYLAEHAGDVVGKERLIRAVWADTFVTDDVLIRCISGLRRVFEDDPKQPRFVETIPKGGYRLIAPVERASRASLPQQASVEALPSGSSATVLPPILFPDQAGVSLLSVSGWQSALRKRKALSVAAALVCIALLALGGATRAWRRLGRRPEPVQAGKIMLVVLPFENLTGDPDQEYLSDGMTEELSQRLGNLNPQRLGVIGRTSAMTYKRVPRTISQIGKELAVGYVLEGSVRRQGSKLRVTAQLVEVSNQAHVWGQDYDRDVRDLLQAEDEVAFDIARQIGVSTALGQPRRPLLHTPNPDAHEAYLLGRYYWNKRTPAGWETGQQYFRRAIEKDPKYAAAYAGLAECRIPRREAQAGAMKAVELDPTSGEARMALGWVELYRYLDLAAAGDALKVSVQLDPNYAPAHHTFSAFLEVTGRFQEAISEEKQAVLLDPLAPISRASLAELLSLTGQNDRGVEQLELIFAMDPQFPKAHEVLGIIYTRKRRYKEAIREFQLSEESGGEKLLGLLGYAYALSGNKYQALRVMSQLQYLEKTSGKPAFDLAIVETGLGNKDEALNWLEKTYQKGDDGGLLWLKVDPMFDSLRSEPRFQALVSRMKFSP